MTAPQDRPWTPGDWRIGDAYEDDEGHRELPIHTAVDGHDFTPATVCLQFPTVPGMQDANARLIAAAPKLAEIVGALIQIADWDHDECAAARYEFNNLAARAKPILAKALGERP